MTWGIALREFSKDYGEEVALDEMGYREIEKSIPIRRERGPLEIRSIRLLNGKW
jgi:hypothetical protein